MAGPNLCLLAVKGRLHLRHQVCCYKTQINLTCSWPVPLALYPLTHFCFLKSNLRHRRSDEPEAHFTDENPCFGLRALHCWRPTEPSDGTIHSWPGQSFWLSCPAASYCSRGTMLTVVRNGAEPARHEESPKTLVHLHRWEEANGRHQVTQIIQTIEGPILAKYGCQKWITASQSWCFKTIFTKNG